MADLKFDHVFVSARDFEASIGFYEKVLKLSVDHKWQGDDGKRGAVLKSMGGFSVTVAEKHDPNDGLAGPAASFDDTGTIHLHTESLARVAEDIDGSQYPAEGPEKTHWGVYWIRVEDPDGVQYAIFSEQL